jgi:hypothetical protein
MSTEDLIQTIQDNTEWLETSEGDLVECIGIENLEAILEIFLGTNIKISQS